MSWVIILTNKFKGFLQPSMQAQLPPATYDDGDSISATTICESPYDAYIMHPMARTSDATLPVHTPSLIPSNDTPVVNVATNSPSSFRRRLFRLGFGPKSRLGSKNRSPRRASYLPHQMEYESPEFLTSEARKKQNNPSSIVHKDVGGSYRSRVHRPESEPIQMRPGIPYIPGCCF